jgi:hypothetical protein
LFQVIRCPSDAASLKAPFQGSRDLLVLCQLGPKKFGHDFGGQIVRRWPKSSGADDNIPELASLAQGPVEFFSIVRDREHRRYFNPDCKKAIRDSRGVGIDDSSGGELIAGAENDRTFNHTLPDLPIGNIFSISKKRKNTNCAE